MILVVPVPTLLSTSNTRPCDNLRAALAELHAYHACQPERSRCVIVVAAQSTFTKSSRHATCYGFSVNQYGGNYCFSS